MTPVFRRTLSLEILILVVMVASSNAQLSQAAPPAPPRTTSWYIGTTNSSTIYGLGCQLGSADLALAGTQYSMAFLYFGDPYVSGSTYGTYLYALGTPTATVDNIRLASIQFASGYYTCTGSDIGSQLELVITTTNGGSYATYGHGQVWSYMIDQARAYNATHYASHVTINGGSDMELGWNTAAQTKLWVDGYVSNTVGWRMYDSGDAAGCKTTSTYTSTPFKCSNPDWYQDQVWYKSWGVAPAWPAPQVYQLTQAQQWQKLSQYAAQYKGSSMSFQAVTTQEQACVQKGCSTYSAAAGWAALFDQLATSTWTIQSAIKWSTDMKWQYP